MAEASAELPQRKVSRYRSQRVQASQHLNDAPPLPTSNSSENATSPEQDPVARSRSRYRAKPLSTKSASSADVETRGQRIPAIAEVPGDRVEEPRTRQDFLPRHQLQKTATNGAQKTIHQQPACKPVHSAAQINVQSEAVKQALPQKPRSPPSTGDRYPSLRSDSSQSPPMDGPPVSGQIRATPAFVPNEDDGHGIKNAFGLFKRKKDTPSSKGGPPGTALSGDSGPILEPVDAPVSAVNAGERRVLLECGTYKMMYPVTPTTTPVDLIKSAAITMSEPINVKSAILLEYFGKVGVHRAIRRYEHLRDVMNSWDHDSQNSVLLIDPGTGTSEAELSLLGAPKSKPGNVSWSIYYSQNVGRWDKRIIHLKRDGQITMQKDSKKPNEQTNICHLSDFDIYAPTQEKIKKTIKPPKKHCYAIKSQQKSNMFEDSTNFVHFFCTGDQAIGEDFHAAIQAWRSWYLVHELGQGDMVQTTSASAKKAGNSKAPAVQTHQRMASIETPYQLGTFTPLLDLHQFSKDNSDSGEAPQSPTARVPRSQARHTRHAELADDEPLMNLARRSNDHKRSLDRSHTQSRQDSDLPKRTDSAHPKSHRPLVDLSSSTHARGGSVQVPDNGRSRPSMDTENAFTGEGLLAQSQDGWGNGFKGRGVIDGSRAKGPMVQMESDDQFANGSLLQAVEKRQGHQEPVIARERLEERETKTGEGV